MKKNDEKFDDFEEKLNFRFEEEGGINVTTHQRTDVQSLRVKDEKKKNKKEGKRTKNHRKR